MNHRYRFGTLCVGLLVLGAPAFGSTSGGSPGFDLSPSVAQEPAPMTSYSSDYWRFTLKPYFWAAAITGDVDPDNLPEQDLFVSFNDIWDSLDMAGMIAMEARKGDDDVAFLGDIVYMKLEDDGQVVDSTLEAFMAEFDVTMRPWEPKWLEGLFGLRYWNIYALVDPNGPPRASKTQDWVDPVVGARATFHPFDERWTSQLRGDFGGFSVGSKSTWQLAGDLQYAFSTDFSAAVGYRALNFDYSADNADYDLTFYGPTVGINWSF